MIARTVVSLAAMATLLVSCGPTPEQIQTAIAQTEVAMPPTATATPEPTPTPKPITGADIEPLLFVPGDFGVLVDGAQILIEVPKYWGEPVFYRRLQFNIGQVDARGVEVAVYDKPISEEVFFAVGGMSGEPIDGLGDASGISTRPHNKTDVTAVWRRCNYLASINVTIGYDFNQEPVRTYARRLDERLAKVLCP